jgi:hypothetical protein
MEMYSETGIMILKTIIDMRKCQCNFGSSSSLVFSLFKDMVNLDLQVDQFVIFCFSFFVLALIQLELYIVLVMLSSMQLMLLP